METLSSVVPEHEDLPFEENVRQNRYNFQAWWQYLNSREMPPLRRFWIYERALLELPGSYKFWYNYLYECEEYLSGLPPTHPYFDVVESIYERSLTHMHKMPCIWEMYLTFMARMRFAITRTRRAFDCALQALPIMQHVRIWRLYTSFVRQKGIPPETVRSVYRRYLKLEPSEAEAYIDFLIEIEQVDEAVHWLIALIQDENFVSKCGKKKQDLWIELCYLAGRNSERLNFAVDDIILAACTRFRHETGPLWTALAGYYVRLGHFEKARDTFVRAIESVVNTNDFQVVWDAYVEFEYGMVVRVKNRSKASTLVLSADEELELSIARFEALIDRQKMIVSDLMLRKNQHNVNEWHRRLSLFEKSPRAQIEQFENAIRTIDPEQAVGRPNTIWSRFSAFWVSLGRIEDARKVFERGVQIPFKKVEHLTQIWCDYAEMELLEAEKSQSAEKVQEHASKALEILRRATAIPSNYKYLNSLMENEGADYDISASQVPVHQRLWKQNKLWAFYADLEHSYGTFETVCAVYERMFELRVVTPLNVLNYAYFLESKRYYEKSFRVYEKGVEIFPFPHKMEILTTYLVKFVERYKGSKLERTRDLFEQAIEIVPCEFARLIYLMYADFEETYGMARHIMHVYERVIRTIPDEQKPEIFDRYISKAAEWFGITRTRQIFEKAIELVPDRHVKTYSLRYARLEIKLGEYNRARAILTHCSQFCDPRSDTEFWKIWKEFEEAHGNTDTFKEMLRIRRSVIAQYSAIIPETVRAKLIEQAKIIEARQNPTKNNPDEQVSTHLQNGTVPTKLPAQDTSAPPVITTQKNTSNPDEINIDFEEDTCLKVKQVPSTLFGSLEHMGAKAKLKKKSELASSTTSDS